VSETSATPPRPAPKRQGRTRRLECPQCGGVIEVRASGISISAVCNSCGSTVDVANEELKVIAEARKRTREPDIAIGKRGTLAGTEWEVIGFQARSNPREGWTWDEYLLFNPYRGFRFLAHDDEGWTLFCVLRQDVADAKHVEGDRRRYEGPETGEARTDYVLGEFYWRARVGDTAETQKYQANPYLLVQERTGDEIVWSRGVKLAARTVQAAFGLAPPQAAVKAVSQRQRTIRVLWTSAAAILLLIVLHAMSFGASRSLQVFRQEFRVAASDRSRPVVSAPITVPDSSGNLRIDIKCPIQNDWLDLNLSLVREPGGQSYNAAQTIEYYTGRDEDGSWTEGSQEGSVLFADIPGGTYRLLVEADAGAFRKSPPRPQQAGVNWNAIIADAQRAASLEPGAKPQPAQVVAPPAPEPAIPFTIEIRRHVPAQEFFWISLVLLVPYPLYRLLFRRGSQG